MDNIKCRQCGACCRGLILEVEVEDAIREPLIAEKARPFKEDDGEIYGYCLNNREGQNGFGCFFLVGDKCSIHATRPDLCRYFQPDSQQCKDARKLDKYCKTKQQEVAVG